MAYRPTKHSNRRHDEPMEPCMSHEAPLAWGCKGLREEERKRKSKRLRVNIYE